jgi:putative redox protein
MAEELTASATLPASESMKTDIQAGDHTLIGDEPESEGGTNQGPAPVKMALGALASCTSMTVKLYIQHKGWEVGDIETDVYYDISLIKDKDKLSEEERKYVVNSRLRKIRKVVKVDGDFDDDQLKRIRIIAGKCPVNLMMTGSCLITDEVELMG